MNESRTLDRVLAVVPAILSVVFFLLLFVQARGNAAEVTLLRKDLAGMQTAIGRNAGTAALDRVAKQARSGDRKARKAPGGAKAGKGGAKAGKGGAKAGKGGKARGGKAPATP